MVAEAKKKPFDTDAEYIATPFGHSKRQRPLFIHKRMMIDSPSTTR
jgi:hypothetical protein